jgi:hypothetical protein
MAYSNYLCGDVYNHVWLRGLSGFRPDQCGIMLDELVLRPAWEDDKILPLINREDMRNLNIMDRGPVRELARGISFTLRNLDTLKRIVIYCDGLLFERDIAALHNEFTSVFSYPPFQDWRRRIEDGSPNGHPEWETVKSWRIIIQGPRQWAILAHEGDAERERSVVVELRMSDSWAGYYFPPPPPSPAFSEKLREGKVDLFLFTDLSFSSLHCAGIRNL